jgi:hypothetical protein
LQTFRYQHVENSSIMLFHNISANRPLRKLCDGLSPTSTHSLLLLYTL